jgi:hypothetical protein
MGEPHAGERRDIEGGRLAHARTARPEQGESNTLIGPASTWFQLADIFWCRGRWRLALSGRFPRTSLQFEDRSV